MSYDDRLGELEVFAEVARTLSLTLAARRLDVAVSSVSRRLDKLEGRLDTRLVERTTRRVHLTDAGHAFLPECMRALDAYQRATDQTDGSDAALRGHVRMSLPNSFGRRQVVPLLPGFASLHPNVNFGIEFSDRFVDVAAEGFDVAIGISAAHHASKATRPLGISRRLVCAAPGYLHRFGVPTHPSQLSLHECLSFSPFLGGDTWTFARGRITETVMVSGRYRANDADAVRALAIAGEGIAILAEFNASDQIAAGRLVRVLEEWRLPATAIFARMASERYMPRRVAAFVDYLRKSLPTYLKS